MTHLSNAAELAGIYAEAAVECAKDAKAWLGRVITDQLDKVDQAACNAINRPEDES